MTAILASITAAIAKAKAFVVANKYTLIAGAVAVLALATCGFKK